MFEQGQYLFKFDLKSGYHHVDVWHGKYQFLEFRWDIWMVSVGQVTL